MELRVNFNDVKVGTLIKFENYGLRDKLIYKVIEVDNKAYNNGYNSYKKYATAILVQVENGNLDFYKETHSMKKDINFHEYDNGQYLTLEGYSIVNL